MDLKILADYIEDRFPEEATWLREQGEIVSPEQWKWFGDPGHFICGRWCRFHLATQVGAFFVSTVGNYVHPRHSNGSEQQDAQYCQQNPDGEEIGIARHYETMVFNAGPPCDKEGCDCGMPCPEEFSALDALGANTRGKATANHYELCERAARGEYA